MIYGEDDCDEGEAPVLKKWRPRDNLSPTPPRGWMLATNFGGPDHPYEVAQWLYMLGTAQNASKARGDKLYTIARDPEGNRVLLTDPSITKEIAESAQEVYYCLNDYGGENLESELQEKAAQVIAQRKWKAMSMADRIDQLEEADCDADIGLVMFDIKEISEQSDGNVGLDIAFSVAYNG